MTSTIKSKTLTLPEIFNNGLNCFEIPDYQRAYSWEDSQRKDLMLDIENIIPVIFSDYLHSTRRKLFEMPTFFDHEMIYFNTKQSEFYIFDKDAEWNE